MKRIMGWIWSHGIVSTFLAGFFVILPIAITIGIMSWVGGMVEQFVGPNSVVGRVLHSIGMKVLAIEAVASIIGWVLVIAAIWFIGLVAKNSAKNRIESLLQIAVERIPFLRSVYKPVAQVVDMIAGKDQTDMKGMAVVYCEFGQQRGGGFLGLLTCNDVYRFAGQDCHVIYIPTSPVPMSGGIVFVPQDAVRVVDMPVDDLMQIYFSLGVMCSKVIPSRYTPAQFVHDDRREED